MEGHHHQASFDEDTSWESAPAPRTDVLAPVVEEPNHRCLDGKYQAYMDIKILNEKGGNEPSSYSGAPSPYREFAKVLKVHRMFNLHKF